MKIYISADMEGISGIATGDETNPADREYPRARALMLGEVNAAIEGALKAGAREIVVNDSHWNMRGLMLEDLHPAATLISGAPKPRYMMTGIDASFAAVFFIGYHARAGSANAVIDHSYADPSVVQSIWLNGMEVGESGVNAALAGYYGVPVALFTGDQTGCAQARDLLGADLEFAVVKEALGRHTANSLHPTRAHELIRAAAARALTTKRAPFVLRAPITLRLALTRSLQAERCALLPGVTRVSGTVVEYAHDDYATLFDAFQVLLVLAESA